jgi:hypothetical protein
MRDVYIAMDNGATGSLSIYKSTTGETYFKKVPTIWGQDYTQKKKNIDRLDTPQIKATINEWLSPEETVFCYIERPMINPARFQASISAARALEATIIMMESLEIEYEVIDSKRWQKKMLPAGTKGEADLKQASFDIGLQMHPKLVKEIIEQNDADALLMVEYAKLVQP